MGTVAQNVRFEDVVGDTATFFSTYFDRRPMVRRAALQDRVGELLSVGQLDDLIALESVSPSYLRVARDGRGVPGKAYTRTVPGRGSLTDAVVPEHVYELFRSGGTITWNALNHVLPSARHLMEAFAEALACETEVVAFLTPAARSGYAPHHDPVDVYVIQVEGSKDWRVWNPAPERDGGSASYTADQLGEPALETTLHPGDVLYLPYNTPHAAASRTAMSLHLSVTVKPRRWRDLLRETVEALVQDAAFDGFPYLPGDSTATELAGQVSLLRDRLAGIDLPAEVARLSETGRKNAGAEPSREFSRLAALDEISPEVQVRRSTLPVTIGSSDGASTGLQVNGHRLAVSDAVAAALTSLDAGQQVTAGTFYPGVSTAQSVHTVQGLARLGVLDTVFESRS